MSESSHQEQGNIKYNRLEQDVDEEPINQLQIIKRLNAYLAWHHFPIRMGAAGMCRGLSTVYAKYVLENRTREFKHILYLISGNVQPDSEHDNAINHFAVEVALTQSPHEYEKSITQKNSMQCLEIDGERLSSSFDFGMSSKNENWPDIISDINLNHDEAMIMSGPNHSVCVTQSNGQYAVYDPNYSDGSRYFEDAVSLVHELRKQLGDPTAPDKYWGLQMNLLRHPKMKDPRVPPLPTSMHLYEKYILHQEINDIEDLNDHLFSAATYCDDIVINALISAGAHDFKRAMRRAILDCNIKAIEALLPKVIEYSPSYIEEYFEMALLLGQEETMDLLSTECPTDYEALFDKRKLRNCIYQAALGGNHKVLKTLLLDAAQKIYGAKGSLYDNNAQIHDEIMTCIFSEKNSYIDIIKPAIKSGNAKCIQTLIELGDASCFAFSDEEKIEYLLLAIRKNQFSAVKYLLTQVSPVAIHNLKMTTHAIERTELSILRELKKYDMPFSMVAQGIIQKKEHQTISLSLSMNILFRKFTDYLMQLLRQVQDAGVSVNFKKLKLFKEHSLLEGHTNKPHPTTGFTIKRD